MICGSAATACEAGRKAARLRSLDTLLTREDANLGWEKPCRSLFRFVAWREPQLLTEYIADESLTPGMRAEAISAAEHIQDGDIARAILTPLLGAVEPIMQEAAIYALVGHWTDDIALRVQAIHDNDTAPLAVREAAAEALDEADDPAA